MTRVASSLAGLGLWIAAATMPAAAQVVDVFEVKGVAVDVTADTAANARDRAHAEGEAQAFRGVLERLTLRADHARLPKPRREDIAGYVRDVVVAEEKVSAVRYIAKLNFRFKPQEIRKLLVAQRIPYAETSSKSVLVLPIYQTAGATLLWDEPNPWREAWAQTVQPNALLPIVLPLGDLSDIAAIGAEQALAGDAQRLSAAAARYSAGTTLVAKASYGIGFQSRQPELEVRVNAHGTAPRGAPIARTYALAAGETTEALLRRVAAEISREIDDRWKRDNLLQLDNVGVLAVVAPITSLGDWLEIRKRLGQVAVVRRADIVLMSRDEVRVNLQYLGDPEQLTSSLEQADLALKPDGDEWTLSLAGPGRAGKT